MKTQRNPGVALVLAFALACTACGGGGGDDDNNDNGVQNQQDVIPSTGNLDGLVTFNNAGTVNQGNSGLTPTPGDGPFVPAGETLVRHAFWSFDLSSIPSDATITNATLRLVLTSIGNDPQGMMVLGRVDHVNYGAVFPPTSAAFTALALDFEQIADLETPGERLIDVTTQVQADFADIVRTRSQFRLRGAIPTDNDPQADFAIFSDADTNTGGGADIPTLTVDYTVP